MPATKESLLFDEAEKKSYSMALLDCSAKAGFPALCPLAFGELGVKERIKNVLSFKKPALVVTVIALILCAAAAVCLLTDPKEKASQAPEEVESELFYEEPGFTSPDPKGVYVQLGFDGAYSIMLKSDNYRDFSCTIAREDGRPYDKGSIVRLRLLEDLEGQQIFSLYAYDKSGKLLMCDGEKMQRQYVDTVKPDELLVLGFSNVRWGDYAIGSPEEAIAAAGAELGKLYEAGIISQLPSLDTETLTMRQTHTSLWSDRRVDQSAYYISGQNDSLYFNLTLSMKTGKIINLTLSCDTSAANKKELFPENVTLDEFCTALNEYWGFGGYTLSGTKDDMYGYDTPVPDGSTKLRDFSQQPYLTVYFDGDEDSQPMFIEVNEYPGSSLLLLGINGHGVG